MTAQFSLTPDFESNANSPSTGDPHVGSTDDPHVGSTDDSHVGSSDVSRVGSTDVSHASEAPQVGGDGANGTAKRLELAPWVKPVDPQERVKPRAAKSSVSKILSDPIGLAAALATVSFLVVGALASYDHFGLREVVAERSAETAQLSQRLDELKSQVDASDAARAHDSSADLRKMVGEIKAGAAANHDFVSQLALLSQRLDHLEHDQSARIDHLGERFDHETAPRLADLTTRIDRLEKRGAQIIPVTPVATAAPAPNPALRPTASAAPIPVGVSNDITGSIEKPKPPLRGYTLEDIRDGMALIDSREGSFTVGPGDLVPGAGRVIKIERRGHDWVVVTSLGVIAAPPD